jgi:queuine tRNA-ribosyltransferase
MSDIFQIHKRSTKSKARTGSVTLARGKIATPVFMGIGTSGTVKGISYEDLLSLNAQIILGNTYHLWLRPGVRVVEKSGQISKLLNQESLSSSGGINPAPTDSEILQVKRDSKSDFSTTFQNNSVSKNTNPIQGNLHKFINWERPILTDSGGFQAFSLSKIRQFSDEGVLFYSQLDGTKRFLSPEISMGIQSILGSDIALVLDECLPAEVTEETAKNAMIRTFEWAKRSQKEFLRIQKEGINSEELERLEKAQLSYSQRKWKLEKTKNRSGRERKEYEDFMAENEFPKANSNPNSDPNSAQSFSSYPRYLFGIPQGAQFPNLRKESAKLTIELDFPGYSIGGVANGGEPEEVMYDQVLTQTEILEDHKPRHLLGVGTPKDIIEMVKRGIDMFDCVYPTRNARHGSIFVWTDMDKLEYEAIKISSSRFAMDFSPIATTSKLSELQNYTKAYLHHLFRVKELLAYRLATLNNLEFYLQLMEVLRGKIECGEV